MKIVVTGANGLLGQKLVALLQHDEQIELIATARQAPTTPLQQGTFLPLDVTDKEAIDRTLHAVKPDVVIHTAAMTQVDDCETNREACLLQNVTAVEYLVHACNANNIHLVHVSTDFIFDGSEGPLREDAVPNPVNFYGLSKLKAEQYIQAHAQSWCILRTVLVYGVTPNMSRSNIVLWVKKSLEDKKTIKVVNDQWRTPTLAEDLAMGCYLAAKQKATGIYHISGKEMMTPYQIATHVAEFFNLDTTLIIPTDSTQFKQPAARPLKTGFIIEKAMRELSYTPHTFTEGLALISKQL